MTYNIRNWLAPWRAFHARLAVGLCYPGLASAGGRQTLPTFYIRTFVVAGCRQAIRRSLQRAGVVPTDMEWLEHVAVRLMYTGHPAENKYVILKVVACVI